MDATVSDLIAEYLLSVPATHRRECKRVLNMWMRWCSDNGIDVLQVRRFHIEGYKVWSIERLGKAPGTVATELSPICCFYEYLWQEEYIGRNPGEHVKRPQVRKWSDGSWLPPAQAARFLDLAESDSRTFVGAASCLLLLNGLRAAEPLKLDVPDYRHIGDMPVVHVNRKFDWMQEVGLSARTAAAVERAIGKRTKGPLLVYQGKRVPYWLLLKVIGDLGERVGAARNITPHSLRRTFATEARRQKVPDRDIMASGGWSTREMIDRYDMNRLAVENVASAAVTDALATCNG